MQSDRDVGKYTQAYLEHDFEKIQVFYRRKKVLEILDSYKPKTILEVGCGLDAIFNHYKDFDTFYVVEPANIFVEKANQDKGKNQNIFIIQDFLENAIDRLKDIDFDFIVLSGLLHEVINPKLLLKSAKQLCDKNTILHINVPNSDSFHLLWAMESGLVAKGELTPTAKKLQQSTTFDLSKLVDMVAESGFEIIKKDSYFIKPFNHTKMAQLLEEQIITPELLDGLYHLAKYFPQNGSEIFVNCRLR